MTYNRRLQLMFHEYERHLGRPGTLREAVEWGLEQGLLAKPNIDPVAALTADLAAALRTETRIDAEGRQYRANQSVTYTNAGGVQQSLWGDIDRLTTPRDFVIKGFQQRRKGIVDDCAKLKVDVDHYNSQNRDMEQIQLVLDFTDDVAEREALRDSGDEVQAH